MSAGEWERDADGLSIQLDGAGGSILKMCPAGWSWGLAYEDTGITVLGNSPCEALAQRDLLDAYDATSMFARQTREDDDERETREAADWARSERVRRWDLEEAHETESRRLLRRALGLRGVGTTRMIEELWGAKAVAVEIARMRDDAEKVEAIEAALDKARTKPADGAVSS